MRREREWIFSRLPPLLNESLRSSDNRFCSPYHFEKHDDFSSARDLLQASLVSCHGRVKLIMKEPLTFVIFSLAFIHSFMDLFIYEFIQV